MSWHLEWYFTEGCPLRQQTRINIKKASGPPKTIREKKLGWVSLISLSVPSGTYSLRNINFCKTN
jgi:hypothetical protein